MDEDNKIYTYSVPYRGGQIIVNDSAGFTVEEAQKLVESVKASVVCWPTQPLQPKKSLEQNEPSAVVSDSE